MAGWGERPAAKDVLESWMRARGFEMQRADGYWTRQPGYFVTSAKGGDWRYQRHEQAEARYQAISGAGQVRVMLEKVAAALDSIGTTYEWQVGKLDYLYLLVTVDAAIEAASRAAREAGEAAASAE